MASEKQENSEVIEFGQAVGQLIRRFRAASETGGLSWTESSVMTRLANHGPATTAELARAEKIKPQTMGTTIAGLEELGIVVRKPHPTDGRQMIIELTVEGQTLRQTARDARWAWLAETISTLDDRERETLFAATDLIKRLANS